MAPAGGKTAERGRWEDGLDHLAPRAETGPLYKELLDYIDKQLESNWNAPAPEEVRAVIVARLDQLIAEERTRARSRIKVSLRSLVVRERKRHEKLLKMEADAKEETYLRLSLSLRAQHIVLFTSCILLIITGLPLKFHDASWAPVVFSLMGGIKTSGLIHRIAATGLICVGTYHLGYIILSSYGRWNFGQLIPALKDFRDVFQQLKYFIGISGERPKFRRFSYVEKFDYWAVYWGMVIMICSGAMLWFEDISLRFFPKYVIDIAKEAHSDEALLATLAIIIWHFYNVHFNPDKFPMNRTWLTGRITEEEMMHEHPLEIEELKEARRRLQGEGGRGLDRKGRAPGGEVRQVAQSERDGTVEDKEGGSSR